MYNGYRSDTMVNNVFAYGPDGKVFLCAINFPGSWHDGSITANILPYIRNNIGNYKMCVDQGFPWTGDANLILVGPISKKQAKKLAPNLRTYIFFKLKGALNEGWIPDNQMEPWNNRNQMELHGPLTPWSVTTKWILENLGESSNNQIEHKMMNGAKAVVLESG